MGGPRRGSHARTPAYIARKSAGHPKSPDTGLFPTLSQRESLASPAPQFLYPPSEDELQCGFSGQSLGGARSTADSFPPLSEDPDAATCGSGSVFRLSFSNPTFLLPPDSSSVSQSHKRENFGEFRAASPISNGRKGAGSPPRGDCPIKLLVPDGGETEDPAARTPSSQLRR